MAPTTTATHSIALRVDDRRRRDPCRTGGGGAMGSPGVGSVIP